MEGKIFYDIIPPKETERVKHETAKKQGGLLKAGFGSIALSIFKIFIVVIIIALNKTALSSIIETSSYLSDLEISRNNVYLATTLDFSIPIIPDFDPMVTPARNTSKVINLENDGELDFVYDLRVENTTGTLCHYLSLKDDLSGIFQPLESFLSATTTFSEKSAWSFTAEITDDNLDLQNQACYFDFNYNGNQIVPAGFKDQEDLSNLIVSGYWGKIVINKVYYDVDASHGDEQKNEWIELYNPNDREISLKKWEICSHDDCEVLDPQKTIPAFGFVLLSHDNSTWKYWEVPDDIETVHQLGGKFEMDNDSDMLVLKNAGGTIVDQMNWGTPTSTWPNWNENIWEPGVLDIMEGHILARVPTGYDTDQPSDWNDLALPMVAVIQPDGGEVWWVGKTYDIGWVATNPNGGDNELSIDIYYSNDRGKTWAPIVSGTENDGNYEWTVPLTMDDYYVPSDKGRIKITAEGPENFLIWNWDMSDGDFSPTIDISLLGSEEMQTLVDMGLMRGRMSLEDSASQELGTEGATSSDEVLVIEPLVGQESNGGETTEEVIIEDSAEDNESIVDGESTSTSDEPSDAAQDENDTEALNDAEAVNDADSDTPEQTQDGSSDSSSDSSENGGGEVEQETQADNAPSAD